MKYLSLMDLLMAMARGALHKHNKKGYSLNKVCALYRLMMYIYHD